MWTCSHIHLQTHKHDRDQAHTSRKGVHTGASSSIVQLPTLPLPRIPAVLAEKRTGDLDPICLSVSGPGLWEGPTQEPASM